MEVECCLLVGWLDGAREQTLCCGCFVALNNLYSTIVVTILWLVWQRLVTKVKSNAIQPPRFVSIVFLQNNPATIHSHSWIHHRVSAFFLFPPNPPHNKRTTARAAVIANQPPLENHHYHGTRTRLFAHLLAPHECLHGTTVQG